MVLFLLAACKREPSRDDSAPSAGLTVGARAPEPTASASSVASSGPGAQPGVVQAIANREIFFSLYTKAPLPPAKQKVHAEKLKERFPKLRLAPAAHERNTLAVLYPPAEEWPPPTVEDLEFFGRGMDKPTMVAAAGSKGLASFGWVLDADAKHAVLRDAIKLMGELAVQDGGYVWDVTSRELYTVEAWKLRETSWDGDIPDVPRLFTIHYYEAEGRHRAISLGLAKLGVPDLVLEDVPKVQAEAAMTLFNACAQLIAEGAQSDANGRFRVDFAAIKHKEVRERLQRAAGEGATMRGDVLFAEGKRAEGDPENRLLELRFDGYPGETAAERQAAALLQLVGAEKENLASMPEEDPELDAVKKKVQAKVPTLAAMVQKGIPLGESLLVKGPFATDEGSVEWMWVEVSRWDKGIVSGTLVNQPYAIKKLKLGAKVELRQDLIADYLLSRANGKNEGGESNEIIEKRQRK